MLFTIPVLMFLVSCFLYCRHFYCSDEEEEQAVDATARMSTSRTLIVSEAQHDGDESSPPQQDIVQPSLVESPRASPLKGARMEPSKDSIQFPGGSSTPSLDDVNLKSFNISIILNVHRIYIGYIDFVFLLDRFSSL